MEKRTLESEEQVMREDSFDETSTNVNAETEIEGQVDLVREAADWKDKYLRSMAEFENYRRRSNQEKADWIKLATQKLALEVCDVLDNFERALSQVDESKREDTFVKGVIMIEQQLRSVLEKEGVRRIDALGKPFDPAWHEALAHIPSEYEEDVIAAVIQNGYMIHDKVLRPSRVAVSSGKKDNTLHIPVQGDEDADKE
jgi:molecular chaperone GrpE